MSFIQGQLYLITIPPWELKEANKWGNSEADIILHNLIDLLALDNLSLNDVKFELYYKDPMEPMTRVIKK